MSAISALMQAGGGGGGSTATNNMISAVGKPIAPIGKPVEDLTDEELRKKRLSDRMADRDSMFRTSLGLLSSEDPKSTSEFLKGRLL